MKRIPGTSDQYYIVEEIKIEGRKPVRKLRLWHDCALYKKGRHGIIRAELEAKADYKYLCPNCEFNREGRVEHF